MRCFVAIPLDKELRVKIYRDFSFLSEIRGVKLIPPENLHITLNFLGEIDLDLVSTIKEKIDRVDIEPFSLKLRGISAFPSIEFIRIVYLGVEIPDFIKDQLKQFSSSLGGEPFSSLHLTIARVKRKVDLDSLFKRYFDYGKTTIDRIVLYQSVLARPNPIYKELYVKHL